MQLNKGNLFDTKCDIIAHGVNCRGAFGSGIAGQIARLFPFAKVAYLEKFKREGWRPGEVQIAQSDDEAPSKIIANCATQLNYGSTGVYVDYEAIGIAMSKVLDFADEHHFSVAIPRIGCGLAGGQWKIVSNIIQQCLQERKTHLEVWEL